MEKVKENDIGSKENLKEEEEDPWSVSELAIPTVSWSGNHNMEENRSQIFHYIYFRILQVTK